MNRLEGALELLDGELDAEVLRGNLQDMARVNRWLGGWVLSRRAVIALMSRCGPADRRLKLLDLGTGGADIPVALHRWFDERGVAARITAADTRDEIVAEARRRAAPEPAGLEIRRVPDDGLPFPDGTFDVGHSSMVLHHLDPSGAERFLREMARVSRLGVVVNDLDRTWRFWLGAKALATLMTRNGYTRNDGPLSVRRAYRPDEVVRIAERAGLREVRRFVHPFGYRYAIAFARHDDGEFAACGLD